MVQHRYDAVPEIEDNEIASLGSQTPAGLIPGEPAGDSVAQVGDEHSITDGSQQTSVPASQTTLLAGSDTDPAPQQADNENGKDSSTSQLLPANATSDVKSPTSSIPSTVTWLPSKTSTAVEPGQADTKKERKDSAFKEIKHKASVLISPQSHDHHEDAAESTAREYNHERQTHRLWRLSTGECLLTFLICGAYAGVLVYYSRMDLIDTAQRHWFNAIITGISLMLGVNLTASLRSYAKLLRWLLLAQRYQPLEVFDLVLGCDSLWNVIKLVFKGKNLRDGKRRHLPSWTQFLALAWLMVNLSITVFVGMIGLNFSLDVNQQLYSVSEGLINVTDWSTLANLPFYNALQEIQSYGIRGFPSVPITSLNYWDASSGQYETANNGTTKYWFSSFNPTDVSQGSTSPYFFMSTATCKVFNVTDGQYGNLTWFVYDNKDGRQVNTTYPNTRIPGPGGLLASSNVNSTCDEPGCVNINVFMSKSNVTDGESDLYGFDVTPMPVAKFYQCVNTMSPIMYDPTYTGQAYANSDTYQVSASLRYQLAGSIGWDGQAPEGDSDWTFQPYDMTTEVSSQPLLDYGGVPSAVNMADFVSSFAIKGISSMDDLSVGLPFTQIQGLTPTTAQVLDVTWRFVIPLLSGIPLVHLLTLLIVFFLANQAIIKDDSHISMAKLYANLLHDHDFDHRGCMLKGDQIIREMGNPLVAYGWNDSGRIDHATKRRVFHVDVFEKDADAGSGRRMEMVRGWRNKFPRDVLYDGGVLRQRKSLQGSNRVQDEPRRELDARDYF